VDRRFATLSRLGNRAAVLLVRGCWLSLLVSPCGRTCLNLAWQHFVVLLALGLWPSLPLYLPVGELVLFWAMSYLLWTVVVSKLICVALLVSVLTIGRLLPVCVFASDAAVVHLV
jgi:hypothetical protein